MQEKLLFEYAVIRIMPRVERQEFFNAGIIMYCAANGFLATQYTINAKKAAAFCADIDLDDLAKRLHVFERICRADKSAGPLATLPPAARFRWLTAVRSTMVQTSPVHPGFSVNLEATMNYLFETMVL